MHRRVVGYQIVSMISIISCLGPPRRWYNCIQRRVLRRDTRFFWIFTNFLRLLFIILHVLEHILYHAFPFMKDLRTRIFGRHPKRVHGGSSGYVLFGRLSFD